MSADRRIGLGILAGALLVVAAVAGVIITNESRSLKYTIYFEKAEGLQKGDRVQINGVDIGVVQSVALQSQPPRVDIRVKVDPEHAERVRADATATIDDIAFPNVSGQKVVTIHNSGSEPPLPPMQDGEFVEGMDGLIDLKMWQAKKKFGGSSEAWKQKMNLAVEKAKNAADQIREIKTSPQVQETMSKLRNFMSRMASQGRGAIDELSEEWPALRENGEQMVRELTDFGRKYLADQIRLLLEEIEKTLEEWRSLPSPAEDADPAPDAV